MASPKQYYFTLEGSIKRLKDEYNYYTNRPWSLEDVGNFWDTVKDYDVVNSEIYPYYRRFTNSFDLATKFMIKDSYTILDIQSRSGNGTEFWSNKINIDSAVCVDFSDYLISLARKRLNKANINNRFIKIPENIGYKKI